MKKLFAIVQREERRLIGIYSNKSNLWKATFEKIEGEFWMKRTRDDLKGVRLTYASMNRLLGERNIVKVYSDLCEPCDYSIIQTNMNEEFVPFTGEE